MTSREAVLGRVRSALGRVAGTEPAGLPAARICVPDHSMDTRIRMFCSALEKLAGKTYVADSPDDARRYIDSAVGGKSFVASNSPLLRTIGIGGRVRPEDHRLRCSEADVGITGAAYGLAETGSLVMLSNTEEARLISLLPPLHIAVLARDKILTGLDELFAGTPLPAGLSSSMVLITGPSRTADIEQILVRGVHGPGELHVVIL